MTDVDRSGRFEFCHLTFTQGSGISPFIVEKGGVSGWFGAAEVRRETPDRAASDGQVPLPGYRRGRLVELRGHALANSHVELAALEDSFNALPVSRERLTHYRPTGSRWAWAQLMDSEFMPMFDNLTGHFELQLFCDEPWKYGQARTFTAPAGGAVLASTRGSAPAWPVVEITGPTNGSIGVRVGEGETLWYRDPIPGGQSVRVDSRTMSVVHSVYGEVMGQASGGLSPLPPGQSYVHFNSTGGSARFTVTDTYF